MGELQLNMFIPYMCSTMCGGIGMSQTPQAWWNLPCLYEVLRLAEAECGEAAGAWYHRRWLQWTKQMQKLGLAGPHIRRSIGAQLSPAVQAQPGQEYEESFRVLPWYSISSFALVALLVKLGCDKWGRLQHTGRRKSFRALRIAWLRCWGSGCPNMVHSPFTYLTEVSAAPGLPLEGVSPVQLAINRGRIDLSGLVASNHPVAVKWCAVLGLPIRGAPWEFTNFLVALLGHASLHGFFKQLIVVAGAWVELGVSRCTDEVELGLVPFAADLEQALAQGHAAAKAKKRLLQSIAERVQRAMAERMLKYFTATLQAFHGQQYVSDSTRHSASVEKPIPQPTRGQVCKHS